MTKGSRSHKRFSRRRAQLVKKIEEKGIKDQNVLQAVNSVPRHIFVDTAFENRAYEDSALPIGNGQTISQPYTVAAQTELLEVKKGDKILEIGTGSGYQAAILLHMGAEVYSVERHEKLYLNAKEILQELGYRPHLKLGDGSLGWSAYAPYDGIVVTAGAPVVPEDLKQQLEIGGKLVVPVGDQKSQVMIRITRTGEDEFKEERLNHFKFVPLIGEKGWD
ncbi:MAG: protein-L-isoaspartate(D-aspartate) O-methyltransferase [Rhodohalobacter sp.]|nr:protein-L-isoaspartate(D-aspartate) O-methyltransferase [Rhodohalobacter sp.]MDZ7756479.1 protein-L-isoaspartate(D-aspartate) O-methyltransferase [Rhodohalobacter sp.]